jgi:hypothetical protein
MRGLHHRAVVLRQVEWCGQAAHAYGRLERRNRLAGERMQRAVGHGCVFPFDQPDTAKFARQRDRDVRGDVGLALRRERAICSRLE